MNLILVFALLFSQVVTPAESTAPVAPTKTPVDLTKDLVAAFINVKTAPKGKQLTDAEKKYNEGAYAKLDAFINFEVFIGSTIDSHKSAFKPAELKEFKQLFRELIREIAYGSSGSFLKEAELSYKLLKNEGAKMDVQLHTYLKKDDMETDVTFHWVKNNLGVPGIVDVSFDDEPLVMEYRNQFAKIIKKRGVAGLLEKMRAKLKAVKAGEKKQ